jgi:hypothetical protein
MPPTSPTEDFLYDPFLPTFHADAHDTYRALRDRHPCYQN